MDDFGRIQNVVQNSNLVATVQEFVPRSLEGSGLTSANCKSDEPKIEFQKAFNHLNIYGKKNISNFKNTEPESSKIVSKKFYYISGETSCSNWSSSSTLNSKKNELESKEDPKYLKTSRSKNCSKWKNYNCSDDISYIVDPSINNKLNLEEKASNVKTFFQSFQNVKVHDSNNLNQVKYYKKWKTKYNSSNAYFKHEESKHDHYGSCRNNEKLSFKNKHSYLNLQFKKKNNMPSISFNILPCGHAKKSLENRHTQNIDGKFAENTNQREQLIDLLVHGILECLVCCEPISPSHAVWSCSNCYHVLHLKCVIKWAKSSKSQLGWRCPACQNVTETIPNIYYCFCGKLKDPEWNHQDCPHSCGEICGKSYSKKCSHKCNLLCHPGPCPQCSIIITKSCSCQKTVIKVQCSNADKVICNEICGKELNCLQHTCSNKCHVGECKECDVFIDQDCYCQKNHRKIKCSIDTLFSKNYSCETVCGKKLSCENHICQNVCHQGECPKCLLTPDNVKFCPCGKTKLISLENCVPRISCTDSIPTCDSICGKKLSCGPSEKPHTCQSKCHEGPCPGCVLEMMVKCRCGHKNKVVSCRDFNTQSGNILCEKRCLKKRNCGRHKCNQVCCTGVDHDCPLSCNRLLQCGRHRCEDACHPGHCKPCLRASFEELSCECGGEVIYPPVPCGTKRPTCERPCSRTHSCDHPPVHNCHSSEECPPCTILTKKYCHGRHELRKAVPCHQNSFSCGLPCGKELECGMHKCILPCHSGSCLKQDQFCSQPCTELRPDCGHVCGLPCHSEPCTFDNPCKEKVRVTCECGRKYTTRDCYQSGKEFQSITTAKLATKMEDLKAGQEIFLSDISGEKKKLTFKTLECDDECKIVERNRRLAEALQIKNPNLTSKLIPRYSDYLKNWAKRDPRFCQMVHNKLTDLVQLSKQSKQKYRSYSFDPMNREKRHFIHEYSDHFGCDSVAYDQEPKRNVVVTALKDKSWLPSVSIVEFIQKENSPRKVPVPVINTSTLPAKRDMEMLPSKILGISL